VTREMAPTVKYLHVKKDGPRLVALSKAFKHAYIWEDILSALEDTLQIDNMEAQRNIIRILQNDHFRRSTWIDFIPGFFEHEMRIIVSPEVVQYVNRHEQSLLLHYFKEKVEGQNVPDWKKKAWDLLSNGFWRWTAPQQEAFAAVLLKNINDPNLDVHMKTQCIERLSHLPFADPKHLA
jgi:hypothetical protein